MRIFVAVPLPQSIKDSLKSLCQARIPSARWEHPADFHVTVRFIGDVEAPVYDRYMAALKTVQCSPFSLVLQGVGKFPLESSRPPKVVWAGLKLVPELTQLHTSISSILEANGLPKDKFDDYNPHITLARLRLDQPSAQLDHFLQQHADFQTETFPVNDFVVYQSERAADGANYKEIARFPFNH